MGTSMPFHIIIRLYNRHIIIRADLRLKTVYEEAICKQFYASIYSRLISHTNFPTCLKNFAVFLQFPVILQTFQTSIL